MGYRTGIYYTNAEDLPVIEKVFSEVQKEFARKAKERK